MNPEELTNLSEVMAFRDSLNVETDRGAALVCAAYLEEELKTLLEKTLVDDAKIVDRLFEYPGPLGTFSSKIDLAFVTGCIGADAHRGLHLIKKIRNSFAHCHKQRSFSDQDIASQCGELRPLNAFPDEKNCRKLFVRACITILAGIHAGTATGKHAVVANSIDIHRLHGGFEKLKGAISEMIEKVSVEDRKKLLDPDADPTDRKIIFLNILNQLEITADDFLPRDKDSTDLG